MKKKAKDNEGTRCNLNPPHLKKWSRKRWITFWCSELHPQKTNMDTQNAAILKAGDTFLKPLFLASMLDFGGVVHSLFRKMFFERNFIYQEIAMIWEIAPFFLWNRRSWTWTVKSWTLHFDLIFLQLPKKWWAPQNSSPAKLHNAPLPGASGTKTVWKHPDPQWKSGRRGSFCWYKQNWQQNMEVSED